MTNKMPVLQLGSLFVVPGTLLQLSNQTQFISIQGKIIGADFSHFTLTILIFIEPLEWKKYSIFAILDVSLNFTCTLNLVRVKEFWNWFSSHSKILPFPVLFPIPRFISGAQVIDLGDGPFQIARSSQLCHFSSHVFFIKTSPRRFNFVQKPSSF